MKKMWISGIGLLVLAAILTGCSHKEPSLDANSGITAKGRFVEEEIEVPEELRNSRYINGLVYDNKIEILAYSRKKDQYFDYIYDGQNWEAQNSDIENVADKITIKGIVENTGGGKYYYGYDRDLEYYMIPAGQESPALLAIEPGSFSVKNEKTRIEHVTVREDGTILISMQDRAILFSEKGNRLFEFAQDYNEGPTRGSSFLTDTSYTTILNKKLVSYSLKEGEMSELNSGQEFDVSSGVFSDREGSIYVATPKGVYHMNENSSIVEKIIDGNLNSMSLQTHSIQKLFKNERNQYFCVMSGMVDGDIRVFKYTYDPDISTLPQDTVTVYSLNDSPTLRQAASLMQSQNPNVRLEIRIAAGKEYESLSEDFIRSLNAELLNGDGADVIILDGLPKEAYIEKGILVNLRDLYSDLQKDYPLLPNITQNYVDAQGNIYYLPVRFKMPVVMGEKDAVKMLSSIARRENSGENIPVMAADNYGNLERLFLNICY